MLWGQSGIGDAWYDGESVLMDSPEIDGGIDALVEQIGNRLLERLGRSGDAGLIAERAVVWSGPACALELDLSGETITDGETREVSGAASDRGIYAVWTAGARLAAAVAALTSSETAVGVRLEAGLSSVAKAAEAQNAIRLGAQAVEIPLDLGLALANEWDRLFADLRAAAEPAAAVGAAFVVAVSGPDLAGPSLARAAALARLAGGNAVRVVGSVRSHQPPTAEHVGIVAQALGAEAETLAEGLQPELAAAGAVRLSSPAALRALTSAEG